MEAGGDMVGALREAMVWWAAARRRYWPRQVSAAWLVLLATLPARAVELPDTLPPGCKMGVEVHVGDGASVEHDGVLVPDVGSCEVEVDPVTGAPRSWSLRLDALPERVQCRAGEHQVGVSPGAPISGGYELYPKPRHIVGDELFEACQDLARDRRVAAVGPPLTAGDIVWIAWVGDQPEGASLPLHSRSRLLARTTSRGTGVREVDILDAARERLEEYGPLLTGASVLEPRVGLEHPYENTTSRSLVDDPERVINDQVARRPNGEHVVSVRLTSGLPDIEEVERIRPTRTPFFGDELATSFEVLAVSATHAAVRVVTRDGWGNREACAYPGMGDPRDGVSLFLVTLATHDVQAFHVYPVSHCMRHEASARLLAMAKHAFRKAGLDIERGPLPLQEAGLPFSFTSTTSEGGGLGERRIDSRVVDPSGKTLHELGTGYSIAGVGSASLSLRGAIRTGDRWIYVIQRDAGNMSRTWTAFHLSPPLTTPR
jgi:hypothetical protein